MMKCWIFFVLSCLVCLTGCTTKTSLGYTSVIEKQENKNISLKIEEFEDKRPDGQQVGALRNLYGMPIVKIVTDDNIPNWVMNAFKIELTNAGYSIANADSSPDYLIEGKIIKAFASTYFIYHGRMTIEISLKRGEDIVFQKVYETKKDGGVNWIGQSSMCAETLKYNLQEICKRFEEDIRSIVLPVRPM